MNLSCWVSAKSSQCWICSLHFLEMSLSLLHQLQWLLCLIRPLRVSSSQFNGSHQTCSNSPLLSYWQWHQHFSLWTCDENEVSRAEQFFKVNVIRLVDENCKEFKDGDPTTFSWTAFGSTLAVWFIIFLCVFKGVSSSSYIVWATVPIPVLFVIIMIINGNMQDGASDGIKKYFSGKEGAEATSSAS